MSEILQFPTGEVKLTNQGPVDPPVECSDGHGLLSVDWGKFAKKPPLYAWAVVHEGNLTLKVAFPKSEGEDGDVYEIPQSRAKVAALMLACAKVLAFHA